MNTSITSHNYDFFMCGENTEDLLSEQFSGMSVVLTTVTTMCIRRDDKVGGDDGRDGGKGEHGDDPHASQMLCSPSSLTPLPFM